MYASAASRAGVVARARAVSHEPDASQILRAESTPGFLLLGGLLEQALGVVVVVGGGGKTLICVVMSVVQRLRRAAGLTHD